MWLGDCFVRCCYALNGVPARIVCLVLLMGQGAIFDYYLIKHQTITSIAWVAFDILNVALFIVSFVVSRRHLDLQRAGDEQTRAIQIGWFTWLVYAVSLVARMAIAFNKFTWRLDEKDFFGPNTLKTTLALSSCVFIFLLMSHHDAPVGSERRRYIEDLTGTVVFDVLDTVDILEVLFDRESRDMFLPGLQRTVLGVAGINLIIPTIPLVTLSLTNFGMKKMPKRLVALHRLLMVLAVNLPNLIVRMVLWHGFSVGISPFMLKNIILICMTCYEFYEHKKEKFDEHAAEEMEMGDRNHISNGHGGSADPNTVNLEGLRGPAADDLTDFPMESRFVSI